MKMIHKARPFALVLLLGTPLALGCSGNSTSSGSPGGTQAPGAGAGNTTVSGGAPSEGGLTAAGGNTQTSAPVPPASGGVLAGGAGAPGSAGSGGDTGASGGITATPKGGSALGGSARTAGNTGAGGTSRLGGTMAPGGNTGAAGTTGGGGGVTTLPPIGGRVRTIMPLDRNWLFNKGDATGADQTAFADSGWIPVSVPHDWAIEGPFAQDAPTTGRGGYLPSGIGWYRTHFTLPATVTSDKQVFIEFDGVMGNSTAYINGTQLGNHPYGYVSFRYDMTKSIKFGAENVLAVKTDTSKQPASRFYAGAGI